MLWAHTKALAVAGECDFRLILDASAVTTAVAATTEGHSTKSDLEQGVSRLSPRRRLNACEHDAKIEKLRLLIQRLLRHQFGRRSEMRCHSCRDAL
jgi:hypothetical protein